MEIGIDHPTDEQLKACWDKLYALEVGEELLVSDCAKSKPKLFIKCCEMYHDCYKNLLFSNDYTRIKKTLTFQEQVNRFNPTEQ